MLAARWTPRPRTPARRSGTTTGGSCAAARAARKIHEAARALFREQGFDKTTLREIAARAGMGASSTTATSARRKSRWWTSSASCSSALARLRARVTRSLPAASACAASSTPSTRCWCAHRISRRSRCAPTTHPEARVARRALALQDQTIGLIAEILQSARARGELRREADVLVAARTLTHAIHGARLAWANGLLDAEGCRASVEAAVTLLFDGIGARDRFEPGGSEVA